MGVFRLALLLGKTVSELDMSWREFTYWNAYLQLEPPEGSAAKNTAALLAQITNMAGRVLPGKKLVKPEDFYSGAGFPGKVEEKTVKTQSLQEQIDFMKSLGK